MTARLRQFFLFLILGIFVLLYGCKGKPETPTIYNVSYDPTRELYDAIDPAFVVYYQQKTGEVIQVKTSHTGSAKAAHNVIDGGKGDVVTLALAADVDAIAEKAQLLSANWQTRLPLDSAPYTSTIVFLVRKGNPKHIKDWGDLVQGDVSIITPDPKSSGGARWNYLAAWGWAAKTLGGEEKAREFVTQIYKRVPVLDTGARGSTTTFAQRGQGDVLLAWENDAFYAVKEFGADQVEIVNPSMSILAEPSVAVVDKNADEDGVRAAAEEYLKFLYTPAAQEIIAQNGFRPRDAEVAKKYAEKFPKMELFTIAAFGGWQKAQATHFAENGVFDQIYRGK